MRGLYLFLAMWFPEMTKFVWKSYILYRNFSVSASTLRHLVIFNSVVWPFFTPSFGQDSLRHLGILK